ncbi:hypothetical protein [Thioalkalivibrio sp.]|uniref:hypothetical protein n=1 Tax=Thioalkalivibrio sp. TaxID=2093813 RepID=UPI00356A4181
MIGNTVLSGLFPGALVALGLTLASAAAAGPAGSLEIQGQVRVAQADSDTYMRLSSSRYSWFSGDRIDTGGGTAILDLEHGIGIGFPRETRASLRRDGGVLRVDLEQGALLYAIPEDRMELVITSGSEVLSTLGDGEYVRVAASGSPGSFGIVQRLDDGQLRVTVRDGAMNIGDPDGNTYYRVEANQRVNFTGDGPGLEIAQIEAITPPAEPDPEVVAEPEPEPEPPEPAAGGVNPMVVGGLALAGAGLAAAAGGGGGGGGSAPPPTEPPPSP